MISADLEICVKDRNTVRRTLDKTVDDGNESMKKIRLKCRECFDVDDVAFSVQ